MPSPQLGCALGAGALDADPDPWLRTARLASTHRGGPREGNVAVFARPAARVQCRQEELKSGVRAPQRLGRLVGGEPAPATEYQALLCTARRDVHEPQGLLHLRVGLGVAELDQLPEPQRLGRGDRDAHPEPGPARVSHLARKPPDDQVGMGEGGTQPAAHVGDRDDGELEALGRVDGHHANPVVALDPQRGHPLALVAAGPLLREVEEAPEVAAVVLLVLGREPHQLPQVRHALLAAPHREDREVVAEGRDHAVDERVQGTQRGLRAQLGEHPAEMLQTLDVAVGKVVGPLALPHGRPDVTGASVRMTGSVTQKPQGVR